MDSYQKEFADVVSYSLVHVKECRYASMQYRDWTYPRRHYSRLRSLETQIPISTYAIRAHPCPVVDAKNLQKYMPASAWSIEKPISQKQAAMLDVNRVRISATIMHFQ